MWVVRVKRIICITSLCAYAIEHKRADGKDRDEKKRENGRCRSRERAKQNEKEYAKKGESKGRDD